MRESLVVCGAVDFLSERKATNPRPTRRSAIPLFRYSAIPLFRYSAIPLFRWLKRPL
jgi:hypothetical protein